MGVRGLMSFVDHNRGTFYRQEKLHDCDIVIDGFGLVYALYFNEGRNGSLNGEFLSLAESIEEFFSNLAECNIRPFVVFDGPIEPEKLPCVLTRLNERIQDVHKLVNNRTTFGRLLPIFAVDVLHHYILTHDISMAVSLIDADDETVAVANYLNCPVLSQDSDYYIYNVIGGYLPFSLFEWKKVWRDKNLKRNTIICSKYHVSMMCDRYRIYDYLLPYVSVLLGNDWIEPGVFRSLVSSMPLARTNPHQKAKKQKECDQRIESVLCWLSIKLGNENAVYDKLLAHLRRTRQQHLIPKVDNCVALYREPPDISETLKVLGIHKDTRSMVSSTPRLVIQGIVRRCRAHPFVINALESNYICLPVILSDTDKPSPHNSAIEIRKLTYRVLLRKYRLPMVGAELLYLQEYDKVRMTYAKSKPISIFTTQCAFCEQCHLVEQPCMIDGRAKFVTFDTIDLLRKIYPKIGSFCEFAKQSLFIRISEQKKLHFDAVMMATLLWSQKTSPDPVAKCALFVVLAWSHINSISETSHAQDNLMSKVVDRDQKLGRFLNLICPEALETASGHKEDIEPEVDRRFLHRVAEWLCILNATIILQQVVENPPTKFPMHHFFTSSSLLHEIHYRVTIMKRNPKGNMSSLIRIIAGRLNPEPAIKNAFECIAAFVASSL